MKTIDDFINNLQKFAWFLIATVLIIYSVFPGVYFGSYKLINIVDSSIYARYATNEKFDENIFFSKEIENNTGILGQLENEISDFTEVSRVQDFARIIFDNQDEVRKIISNNINYQEYLTSVGSSTDDLIKWSEKTSSLDDKMSLASLYLTFLIVTFLMVVPFGFRKIFYICAGVTYMVATLSMFSGGISDYLVANILSFLAKMSSDVFTYKDIESMKIIFSQAFKESTLTFIIFDTVIQICQSNQKEKQEKAIQYLYQSLEFQSSFLKQYEDNSDSYTAKLRVPIELVIKLCNRNIKKISKEIRKKRLSAIRKANLEAQKKRYVQLKELLIYICYKNCDKHTVKEYISYLQRIQQLMYMCEFIH